MSRSTRITARLALLAAVPLAASHPSFAQEPLGLSPVQRPFQSADRSTTEAGKRYSFVCPASSGAEGTAYGTDVYTVDSAVCAAAIHAGALTPRQAGIVTVVMGAGAASFDGTSRNGVTTRSYGPWDRSYTFARDGTPGAITWRTVWSGVPDDFVAPITLECPATRTMDGKVWGTDVYTRDSVICVAAVHAGAITAASGGRVVVTRARHTGEFTASTRNGVAAEGYGPFRDAFTVSAAGRPASRTSAAVTSNPVAPRTIPLPGFSASTTLAPRTIALPGFGAAGAIAPRTIPLPGFQTTGAIAPRTIQLPGWTAHVD